MCNHLDISQEVVQRIKWVAGVRRQLFYCRYRSSIGNQLNVLDNVFRRIDRRLVILNSQFCTTDNSVCSKDGKQILNSRKRSNEIFLCEFTNIILKFSHNSGGFTGISGHCFFDTGVEGFQQRCGVIKKMLLGNDVGQFCFNVPFCGHQLLYSYNKLICSKASFCIGVNRKMNCAHNSRRCTLQKGQSTVEVSITVKDKLDHVVPFASISLDLIVLFEVLKQRFDYGVRRFRVNRLSQDTCL